MTKKTLLLLALAIPLVTMGAGCASLPTTTPVNVPTANTTDPSVTPPSSPATVAPTMPPADGTHALTAAEPDATWVLYTNKALGYTVNTPTKGKYAPTWEMKYVDQSDSHMIEGCYFNINPTSKTGEERDTVAVPDGTKFCHIKNEFGDPPSFFVVDDYATAVGKKFIIIEFVKVTTDVSAFVASDYQKTLAGIMGTFQMNGVSTPVAAKQKLSEESNGKTFLGVRFRYSFEYPNNWFVLEGTSIKSQPESVFISKAQLKEGGEDLGNVSIVINNSSLEKNIRENLISREEITFANRPATKIKFTGDWGPAMVSILVPYGVHTFVISYDPEDKDYSSIEKILNSFSFVTTAQ